MFKKILALSIMTGCLLFTSCGSKPSETSDTDTNTNTNSSDAGDSSTAGDSSEVYTIWIPGDEQEYQFYFDMFENFKNHKEAAGESFEYIIEQQPWSDYWTKLPLEVSEGRGPDLYLAHDAYMDMLLPISKELDLSQEVLDSLKIKGIYLGENGKDKFVPTLLSTYIMFANKELTGLTDTYPETWEELEAKAKEAMDNNSGIIGFDYNFNTLCDLTYRDGRPLTEDGKVVFHKEEIETLLKYENDGISDYLLFGNGSPEEVFNQNSAAYIHGATWMEFWAPEDIKSKMMAFPVPAGKDDSKIVYTLTEPTFGINKNAEGEKYEVLNSFIEFMLTDEKTITDIVKGNSAVPNNSNITVSYEPLTAGDAVLKTIESKEIAYAVMPRELEKIYKDNLEKALSGEELQAIIDNAYIEAENVPVERLVEMEDAFRGSFK